MKFIKIIDLLKMITSTFQSMGKARGMENSLQLLIF